MGDNVNNSQKIIYITYESERITLYVILSELNSFAFITPWNATRVNIQEMEGELKLFRSNQKKLSQFKRLKASEELWQKVSFKFYQKTL